MPAEFSRLVILAHFIGVLLASYEPEERTRLHRTIEGRVAKGMRKAVRRYGMEEMQPSLHAGENIWSEAIDAFKKKDFKIEASSCVATLFLKQEKALHKHFGINPKHIEQWAKVITSDNAVVLEHNSFSLADFLYQKTSEYYNLPLFSSKEAPIKKSAESNLIKCCTYRIAEGYDHFTDLPLYRVEGITNEYVGEWHTKKEDAMKEREDI